VHTMAEVMEKIRAFMERNGIPGRDAYDLPTSTKAFKDGTNYRIEIAGVERASTFEAMLQESQKRGVVVHRAIASVGGSTYCDFNELKDMARMGRDNGIEVVMTVGHRKGWDVGAKELASPEGSMNGFRLRGSDHMSYHLADIMRCIEAGHRAFLVYDEGVLHLLNKMRAEAFIPANTMLKFSVFGGYCSPAGAMLLESLGANSFNPSSDVSLPILGGIRKTVDMPLDVYISIVDAFGGNFRAYEAPEIARIASPCYFKFEPGTSEADIYKPWVAEDWHCHLIKEKIKLASIVMEIMQRLAPEMKTSKAGAPDLVLPEC
jgi:hypothetical protein